MNVLSANVIIKRTGQAMRTHGMRKAAQGQQRLCACSCVRVRVNLEETVGFWGMAEVDFPRGKPIKQEGGQVGNGPKASNKKGSSPYQKSNRGSQNKHKEQNKQSNNSQKSSTSIASKLLLTPEA